MAKPTAFSRREGILQETIFGIRLMECETLLAVYNHMKNQEHAGVPYPTPPTLQRLADELELRSKSVVSNRLDRLIELGYLYDPQHLGFILDEMKTVGSRHSTTVLTKAGVQKAKEIALYKSRFPNKSILSINKSNK